MSNIEALFDKFSHASKIEEVSIFSLNVSEHKKTYIVKTNSLAALQLELLRRRVISLINELRIGITRVRQ